MNKKHKIIFVIILLLLVLWTAAVSIDYYRVCHLFKKPCFTISTITADDGGSGKYVGLGYSFDIKGNFMPLDELKGVTNADFYLFGVHLKQVMRD